MKIVEAIIDRIEKETAVLKTKNGTINIAKKYLPEDAKEGDALNILIGKKNDKSLLKKQEAKNILNEILNSGN